MHAARPQPPPRAGGGRLAAVPRVGRGGGWGGGWGGGGGGREGGALHCTMCAAPHCIVLRLHYIARVVPRCTVRAALHGAVLCCTLRFACCATLLSAAHRSAPCVTCCTAPCVLRCSVQSAARRTAHACFAPLHRVCWVVPLHTVRAVPHSTARAALHCPGRGWFAQAGAGGGHVTGSSPRSWLVRACRCGRGTCDRLRAPVVARARTQGHEGDP